MSIADDMLPGIADALSDDPERYRAARDYIARLRDDAVAQLDYELINPGPAYDTAEGWCRKTAEFKFPEDRMELAEVLARCAEQRQEAGNVLLARLNMAEAAAIFEIYANAGVPRAITSIAQITETIAQARRDEKDPSKMLLFMMPVGSC